MIDIYEPHKKRADGALVAHAEIVNQHDDFCIWQNADQNGVAKYSRLYHRWEATNEIAASWFDLITHESAGYVLLEQYGKFSWRMGEFTFPLKASTKRDAEIEAYEAFLKSALGGQ